MEELQVRHARQIVCGHGGEDRNEICNGQYHPSRSLESSCPHAGGAVMSNTDNIPFYGTMQQCVEALGQDIEPKERLKVLRNLAAGCHGRVAGPACSANCLWARW